jgi:hypothetical protein
MVETRVTDRSTTRIMILGDPFIWKLLGCMLAVRGFLSVDYYPDGVCRKMGIDHGSHAAAKISFGRVRLPPEQKKRKLHKQKNLLFVLVIIVAFTRI